eukprot:COSAG06_NODE_8582_length_2124_cov_1.443951_3_plen_105_part_00
MPPAVLLRGVTLLAATVLCFIVCIPTNTAACQALNPFQTTLLSILLRRCFLPLENVLGLTGSMTSADTVTCGGSEYSAADSHAESSTAAVDQPGRLCQTTPAVG